jgi:hypothetical protein
VAVPAEGVVAFSVIGCLSPLLLPMELELTHRTFFVWLLKERLASRTKRKMQTDSSTLLFPVRVAEIYRQRHAV